MNRKWAAGFTRTQRLYQLFCVISFNDGPRTTHRVAMYLSALFGSISSFYPWYLLWYHRTILFLLIIHLFFFKKANGEGDEPQNFLQESRNGEKKKKCNTLWCFVCAGTSMIALRRKVDGQKVWMHYRIRYVYQKKRHLFKPRLLCAVQFLYQHHFFSLNIYYTHKQGGGSISNVRQKPYKWNLEYFFSVSSNSKKLLAYDHLLPKL